MIQLYVLGYKGYIVIKNLSENDIPDISLVVIGTDSNVIEDYSQLIQSECVAKGIPFCTRKDEFTKDEVKYKIAIGWRWIIPETVNISVIVFHDSLLPKYRGFNPLVTALINGDSLIGATCLLGEREYDAGEIIYQDAVNVEYPIKIEAAIVLIAELYLKIFLKLLSDIKLNTLRSYPQIHENATYSLWRDSQDYYIDWNWDADKIERFVNAVDYPYAGARCYYSNKTVIIKTAKSIDDVHIENRDVGKVIFKRNNQPVIVCGKGLVVIDEVSTEEGEKIDFQNKFRIRFR